MIKNKKKSHLSNYRNTDLLLFLAPALIIYCLFVILPVGLAVKNSFYQWYSPLMPADFSGLENFRLLLKDKIFWLALRNNVILIVASLLLQLPIALGLAILLNYKTFARSFFRAAFFTPMIIPTTAIALLWQYMYEPQNGIISVIIRFFRPDFNYVWLAAGDSSLIWIFLTICWQYIGFHTVIFMAGLSSIPDELYEAARLDGASEWQLCWKIIIPCMKPTILLSATLSVIGSLKYFDLVYLMGAGLPETSRELLATYIYRLAFDESQGRYGYGSAVAVFLLILALLLVIPLQAGKNNP